MRGRVDLIINGSYWLGAALGAVGAFVLLMDIFPVDIGWRLAFGLGAILGIGILLVRRHVPESPRWLFIHGHEQEAERIVDGIEREVREETGEELEEPGSSITVRQRRTISLREVAATAFRTYPKRSFLGLSLFVGQAFIYNSVTFGLGTFLVSFYEVKDGVVPLYLALFAVSNFLGPLLLGHLFDTVGRKPMISSTYIGSALVLAVLTVLFVGDSLGKWGFMALLLVTFFLASAGASSAYLTAQPRPRRGGVRGTPRPGAPLPARPGPRRLLAGHAGVGADHRAGVLARDRADRADPGGARPAGPAPAGAARRRALLGPGPVPGRPARGGAQRPGAAARPHALRAGRAARRPTLRARPGAPGRGAG